MEILFFALGSHGDVHPMLGLAIALRERGHRVAVATSPYYQDLLDRIGMPLIPLGTSEELLEVMRDPLLWDPWHGFNFLVERMMLRSLRPTYGVIAEHYVPGETIVVAPPTALGARVAQEKLGVPLATVHLSPVAVQSTYQAPVLPPMLTANWVPRWLKKFQFWIVNNLIIDRKLAGPINQFRGELGLPPVHGIMNPWWNSPQLALCLFPDWFGPRQPDWPAQIVHTGFPLWDEREVTPISPEVEAFLQAGGAPIAFTPGSAMLHGHEFFRAAVEACQRTGRRGILLTRHPEQIPRQLPPSVRHFDFVPLGQLLPRCAAIVHHAGVGTLAQGLAAGIPHVAMPMAHDQHDNAARLARLGVGASIATKQFTSAALARTLQSLLSSNDVIRRCQELHDTFDTPATLRKSCERIENLAADQTLGK